MSDFNEQLPEWNAAGTEPPAQKKAEGWQPREKPPAGWFNWLFNRAFKCIEEIRGVVSGVITSLTGLNNTVSTHLAETSPHSATSAATASRIVLRDAAGRAKVANGLADDDIAARSQTSRTNTFVVAASNSTTRGRSGADYVCDGVDDQAEINAALTALGSVGGCVVLLEGTYIISGSINMPSNVTLMGQGFNTIVRLRNAHNANIECIRNIDSANGNVNIAVKDLAMDGNKSQQTSGANAGIMFVRASASTITNVLLHNYRNSIIALDNCFNVVVADSILNNGNNHGIALRNSSSTNIVRGNRCHHNVSSGIQIETSSHYNTITENICYNNLTGILINNSNTNIVTNNTCHTNTTQGIYCHTTVNNSIKNNICFSNGANGILLENGGRSIVSGNNCYSNTSSGIGVSASVNNTVTGNFSGNNGTNGMAVVLGSTGTGATGNICNGNGNNGILVNASSSSIITDNMCHSNAHNGILVSGTHNSNISGNSCMSSSTAEHNSHNNIALTSDCDNNNIQQNICRRGSGTNQPANGIRIASADCENNLVTNNDLLTGGATANFSDSGTGTITVAGNRIA